MINLFRCFGIAFSCALLSGCSLWDTSVDSNAASQKSISKPASISSIKSDPKTEKAFLQNKKVIFTVKAPQAIGPYSQAIASNKTVYLSGQIPLQPETMRLVEGDIVAQTEQALKNLSAVAQAAGGDLEHIVKLTIFLTDLANFSSVNETMARFFKAPYPARSTIGVAALPKGAAVEIEAIMVLPSLKQAHDD